MGFVVVPPVKGMVDQALHKSDSQHFQNERASVFAINRPGVLAGECLVHQRVHLVQVVRSQ
jgi:hypothetical protein